MQLTVLVSVTEVVLRTRVSLDRRPLIPVRAGHLVLVATDPVLETEPEIAHGPRVSLFARQPVPVDSLGFVAVDAEALFEHVAQTVLGVAIPELGRSLVPSASVMMTVNTDASGPGRDWLSPDGLVDVAINADAFLVT